MLQATYCVGALLLPLYNLTLISLDADYNPLKSQRKRLFKGQQDRKGYRLLAMAGKLCVYSDVCNVYGKDLVLLRQPMMSFRTSYVNRMISHWNLQRNKIGVFPPTGWPLSMVMMLCAILAALIVIFHGYMKILRNTSSQLSNSNDQHAFTTVFQSLQKKGTMIKSQVFDTDSNTIIVDNSANCILWNDLRDFDPNTYVPIGNKMNAGITSATGQAVPVGIGILEIG